MTLQDNVTNAFEHLFGEAPRYVVRAPGRVNLIGEHTDYNDGFVLPMAIDRAVWIAITPTDEDTVLVHSLDFNEKGVFDLNAFEQGETGWIEYMKSVAWAMKETGMNLKGWKGVMIGDVPLGAGLSSSAALELATARAFAAVSNLTWNAVEMAKLCQKAEREWVGMNCGIMDQLISAAGVDGFAQLIDCRSLDLEPVPLPPGTTVVVLDTSTRRGLVGSAYNERREQCEAAAAFFGVPALRDVSMNDFNQRAHELDELPRRRARHIISENALTLQAGQAMKAKDAELLGQLMNASHASLRDDFEVSSNALNAIVAAAQAQPDCYGARMTGAGFGGCGVALVKEKTAADFAVRTAKAYKAETGLEAAIYICRAVQGASLVKTD